MKKIITTLMLFFTAVIFSQQLTYKSGGVVYNGENKKLSPTEVRNLLKDNSEALALYDTGRNKKTLGNLLFYGGLGLAVTNVIVAATTDHTTVSGYDPNKPYSTPTIHSDSVGMTAAVIGGALVVASIPIKVGYPKKIKEALDKYNASLGETVAPKYQVTLLGSTNQLGFRVEF